MIRPREVQTSFTRAAEVDSEELKKNPILDPAQNDDVDEEGQLDVEWYPLPDWLQDEGHEPEDEDADE